MHSLPVFIRLAGRPVILLGEGDAASAKRYLLERAGAHLVGEESAAALAIVAIEDEAEAQSAITRLKARGILVNAVDRPADCDFTLPAIVDRSPVLIAIGTGGASAGLAKAIRIRLEALMPATLGKLAEQLAMARPALRKRWTDARARRLALDSAFETSGPLDPFTDQSADAVGNWIAAAGDSAPSEFHHLRLSSGDPDQLTLAAARLLGRADTVFHTPDVAPPILNRARADARRISCCEPPTDKGPGLSLFLENN